MTAYLSCFKATRLNSYLVVCPNPPDFILQLVFCFAAVEFRLQAQLPEHPLVKPARGELGIGKVQQDVLVPAQTVGKLADHGGSLNTSVESRPAFASTT